MSINNAKVLKLIDNKTARVSVTITKRHEINGKVQRVLREFLADIKDGINISVGDLVEIAPCKKVSKTKSFAILRVQQNSI